MEMPELPRRIYTLGEEPPATFHAALKKALHDDEYEELKESKLGVFIKFQELGFDWASRLVHYMLGFQLDIKKKYELWSLVGPQPVRFSLLEFENLTSLNCEYIEDLERPHSAVTKELTSFWEMLGVHVEAGPSTQEIIAALERCEGWSRDDRKRLAYLAIFTGYIEGRKYSTPTWVSRARLVMELERFENYPWGRVAFKVLMDSVKGRDISGCYTINGFAQALQVLVYTALPELGATFALNKKPHKSRIWWYQILRTSFEWLEDYHIDAWIDVLRMRYDANLQHFRSDRMCFLDHLFAQQWRFNFKDFKDSEPDQNGLRRRLHGGTRNYYAGTIPSFCQSNKRHAKHVLHCISDMLRIQPINDSNTINEKPTNILQSTVFPLSESASRSPTEHETKKTLTSQRTRISANYHTSSNQNTRITTIKYNKSKREQRRSYSEFAYERLQQGISLDSRAVGEIPSSSNPKTAKPN
uniref:DUF1985 domain-containing protein n=1 Tax=Brassica oleracea var. oleracea TaxID=109376 RepID=A0A0D3DMX6_BRAOL